MNRNKHNRYREFQIEDPSNPDHLWHVRYYSVARSSWTLYKRVIGRLIPVMVRVPPAEDPMEVEDE